MKKQPNQYLVEDGNRRSRVRLVRFRGAPCLGTITFLIMLYAFIDREEAEFLIDRMIQGETVELNLSSEPMAVRLHRVLTQCGVVVEIG